jgi:AcrR family transcriptional regulator
VERPAPKKRRPRRKLPELAALKRPSQPRAQATFDAIVTAAARLLAARGYGEITTNHIAAAAGVGIGSVYEYFPGKDAIVAEVATRLVDRILTGLTGDFPALLSLPEHQITRAWVDLVYATLHRERRLVAVFTEEVPYTRAIPAFQSMTERLLGVSRALRARAGVTLAHETASLHLMINLTTSTILQLVLEPPSDVTVEEMLTALAHRLATWVALEPSSLTPS